MAPIAPIAEADSFPVPLIDGGGLYGQGRNTAPAAHRAAGIASGALVPASGAVVAAIGMSNTRIEFDDFATRARTDARLVDAACARCAARAWDGGRVDPAWDLAASALASAGVQGRDIDVVWVKMAIEPHLAVTTASLEAILAQIKIRWPNVRQVFVSDRIYAGYIERLPRGHTSGEPQGGWAAGPAVRQFVLNHLGETDPFVDWGPYLWANGSTPRRDGLAWNRADFRPDGVHPNAQGAAKVGNRLVQFFATSPATEWYR
ncbi:MAG: hypothetical protein ACREK2_00980 [Gemmatimonadota bacterium]